MIIFKISFSSGFCFCSNADNLVFANLMINLLSLSNTILTYFWSFLGCPQLYLINAKGAKSADIRSPWVRNAYAWGIYTKIACPEDIHIRGICIKGACTRNICTRGTYIKDKYRICYWSSCSSCNK